MADKKITQLTDGGAPQATDEFVIARAGDNFKLDFASIDSNLLDQAVILAPATPARNVIQPAAGDTYPLFIKAHAAQTAELMWWERADGTFIGSIDKEGHVYFQPQRQTGNGISYAISGNADHGGAGHITKLMAFDGWAYSHGPGIVDDLISYRATASADFAGSARIIDFYAADHFLAAAVPNVYGLFVENRGDALATTSYGVYVAAQSGSTTNYGIYVAGGKSVFVDGLVIALIAAPADAAYANGQGGWWWDQANSLPKWKGKTSGGVVVNFTPAAAGSGAPTTATYITQTADAGLSAEQALSSLATGLVKNTTTTGVLSIGAQGTDYYAPGGTDVAVADGGTGSSTASAARTALGLVIDTDVASMTTANAKVPKSLYDANTVLAADTDDTPAAVTMAASTILARLAAGNIKAATPAELRTLLTLVIGTDVAAQGDVRFASHENGQAGVVAPTFWGWQFEGSAFVANRCLLARFVPTKDLAITKMAFMVHAAGAAGNKIDVGIYSGDLATRLGSSGSVVTSPTMASAGVKEIALTGTVNLVAGTIYYAAIVPDTTAGQIAGAMINNNGTAGSESLFGTAIGKFETGVKDIGSGVLPTSITTPTPSSYQGPVLAVRVS